MNKVMGIDPGQKGAIAVVRKYRKSYKAEAWEPGNDPELLKQLIKQYKPDLILLEKQQSMRGQGVSSTFTTGRTYGLLEGVMIGCGAKYLTVPPKTWMKSIWGKYNIDIIDVLKEKNIKDSKKKSISICESLFSVPLITERGRIRDGVADAILIALYGFIGL